MKRKLTGLSRQYQAALRKHLKRSRPARLPPAKGLGRQAMTIGLETLDLARIHEQALITLVLPSDSAGARDAMVRRAGTFFAQAITPIEETHRTALQSNAHLGQMNHALRQRTVALAASNRQLKQEIVRRKSAEDSLRRSEQHSGQLNIARTQRLVQQSVDIVHRFARELRPAVLDDLGLIPALHTFMKSFRARTGIRVSLSAFAAVEKVNGDKRTVLYRVAQEALTNVARHAQASQAEVRIQKLDGAICMKIKDDGKGFQEERGLHGKKNKRLGLLGMRERLEMVGGNLTIESTPGKGTTIQAQVPFADGRAGGGTR